MRRGELPEPSRPAARQAAAAAAGWAGLGSSAWVGPGGGRRRRSGLGREEPGPRGGGGRRRGGPSPARTAPLAEGARPGRVRAAGAATRVQPVRPVKCRSRSSSPGYRDGGRCGGRVPALPFPAHPLQNRPPPPRLAGLGPASRLRLPRAERAACLRLSPAAHPPRASRGAGVARARRCRGGGGQGRDA